MSAQAKSETTGKVGTALSGLRAVASSLLRDSQGNVLDWDLQLWSTPHGTRPGGEPGNLLSARYLEKPFAMPEPAPPGPSHAEKRGTTTIATSALTPTAHSDTSYGSGSFA